MLDPIQNVLYVTGATNGSFFGATTDESLTNCFLETVDFQQEGWAAMTQLGNIDVAGNRATPCFDWEIPCMWRGRHWNEACWVNCGIRERSKQPCME